MPWPAVGDCAHETVRDPGIVAGRFSRPGKTVSERRGNMAPAGSLMIACTPAKQAGNSFEWGQVPQQPDLSWADSVGAQLPGDKIIIAFLSRSSRQYRTQHRGHSESNRQLRYLRRRYREKCIPNKVMMDSKIVKEKHQNVFLKNVTSFILMSCFICFISNT